MNNEELSKIYKLNQTNNKEEVVFLFRTAYGDYRMW
jgi:hypothetical protein